MHFRRIFQLIMQFGLKSCAFFFRNNNIQSFGLENLTRSMGQTCFVCNGTFMRSWADLFRSIYVQITLHLMLGQPLVHELSPDALPVNSVLSCYSPIPLRNSHTLP
uniref:(northern house mosquito) hypothetical protein n=1 Tax=Culex pipiens TaxID=7175 RepID=A0A8D8IV72_CULPI